MHERCIQPKKARWILLCLCFLFVFKGCCCWSYCLGVSFVWRWVGARARSGSWLIVPVCSSSNLKLASAPPNGTMAVWECPVSLTAFWNFSSFLAKWMEIGKQPEGLQKTAWLRDLNFWKSISFPSSLFSLFWAEAVGFYMIIWLLFLSFMPLFLSQDKNIYKNLF